MSPTLRLLAAVAFVFVHCLEVHAQQAWLLVPVTESSDSSTPIEAILAPWERSLPRAAANQNAAKVYEQRQSVAVAQLTADQRERSLVTIDRALEQLALGDLEAGLETLRATAELPEAARDSLLHVDAIAQKLFDACMMHAYLLARQGNSVEAKQQLRSCGMRFPNFRSGQRAFVPSLHGPPQLREAFDQIAHELAHEQSGVLSVSSTSKSCRAFVNGLSVGDTPVRITHMLLNPARVQLSCDNKGTRSHRVVVTGGETALTIDPRFDASVISSPFLQLRYADRAQRESFSDADGLALKAALGIDRLGFLSIHARGNAWVIGLTALDAGARKQRDLGTIEYSEAAGYDPKELKRLIQALTGSVVAADSAPAPVTLSAPPPPPEPPPPAASPQPTEERPAAFPVLGAISASVGVIALATSWALFTERRAYRLREWPSVESSVEGAYARRGVWTVTTLAVGAGVLAISPYFLLPALDAVPTFAWVVGGLGLVAAAVGVGFVLGDEHCGPEIVLPLREPCRSIRADSLFGLEIALTALPLVTLPFNYLLRSNGASIAVSFDAQRKTVSLQATF